MIKSHKQLTSTLWVSAALALTLGVVSPQQASAQSESLHSSMVVASAGQSAKIESSVRLRTAPSVNSNVLKYLQKGEIVSILEVTNSYFYKVQSASGDVGYVSSGSQYISLTSAGSKPAKPAPTPTPTPAPVVPNPSNAVERVISAGMGYLGTPYEFGSSRNNTNTFDCSDFIRQIFMDAGVVKLPADSRQQGDWVKQNSTVVKDISGLKRGDLMFFMSYRGNSASAYAGVNKSTERITHVAIYLGDNKVLHTYSVASGGVRVDNLSASWMNRFLYGGSVIR
ncbi:C40 family peptidase [Paenibacillus agri]|uniref:C40 family peptidase n=1 Tax=Paenibacillus agri TaxID=2744309 RepID=A0A850EN38_9BACL|nr:SH3 domain-containing C40 family peptidase [Paenibacillus agri]NUU61190.1 C40 family peptidase [Paenibacillus agri]